MYLLIAVSITSLVLTLDSLLVKGNKFRDVGFAILYYIQLIIVIALAGVYGPEVFEDEDGEEDTDVENDSVYGYIYVAAILGAVTIALTALVFSTMTRIANTLIKFSLILSCVLAGVVALALLASGSILGGVIGILFFTIMVCVSAHIIYSCIYLYIIDCSFCWGVNITHISLCSFVMREQFGQESRSPLQTS